MKKIAILAVACLFPLCVNNAQWVSNYWAPTYTDIDYTTAKGLAVTVDEVGYCYVTGYAYNDLAGNNDILIIKYGQQGNILWTRTYNGNEDDSDDKGYGIKVDNSGNVYVVGQAANNGNHLDIALLKYDQSGNLEWCTLERGSNNSTPDVGLAIAFDASEYIYVTGYATRNDGKTDIVILKYDDDGHRRWRRFVDGPEGLDSKGHALIVDNLNNICVTGYSNTAAGGSDIVLTKYNSSGSKQWEQYYGGSGSNEDKAFGIAADNSNNIYITGYAYVNNNGISSYDCITLKYSSAGTLQWTSLFNGSGNDEDKAFGIAEDIDGCIYITGYSNRINQGVLSPDYVTIKYNTAGVQQWASFYNGLGNGTDNATGIIMVGNHTVVTGSSWGAGQNYDYATIKYSKTDGLQVQINIYSMNSNSSDFAKDIDASPAGNVVVTGFSELLVESLVSPSAVSTLSLNWGENKNTKTDPNIPRGFSLCQNYPNPFNPSTTIRFEVATASDVKIVVYDMLGRVVSTPVNGFMKPGSYSVVFTAPELASGSYLYEFSADGYRDVKKMSLLK